MLIRTSALTIAIAATLLGAASAAPTPVPGGANAIVALSGKTGQTVFNGVLRIKIVAVREGTAADDTYHSITPDKKMIVVDAMLHNGSHDSFTDLLHYTLADRDAVAVTSSELSHANPHILQGAALRQTAKFLVDRDFVPTKLIVECASCSTNEGFHPVRFAIASP